MLRLKAERLRRGWTQTDAAFHARLTAPEFSRIETGRMQPYSGQLERLARVFGLSPNTLLELVTDDEAAVSAQASSGRA